MILWIIVIVAVLAASIVIGMHLGRFREAYTEMTGMMAGMTMGMLNGFVLGFAFAALAGLIVAGPSGAGAYGIGGMFWGNLFGVIFGLSLGSYFGRAGGLMGVMDGAMGGVMGGSMGAMLAVMVRFEDWALLWTGILLVIIYAVGMVGLVVLIERSAPGHAALHRLAPFFTRAMAEEASEEYDATEEASRVARTAQGARSAQTVRAAQTTQAEQVPQRRIVDYYALLGVRHKASADEIQEAYLAKLDDGDEAQMDRLERALAVLSDPQKRASYDQKLAESTQPQATGYTDYGPPPKQKQAGQTHSEVSVAVGAHGRAPLPATRAGQQVTTKVPPQSGASASTNVSHNGATGAAKTAGGSHQQAQSQVQGHGSQNQAKQQGKQGNGKQGKQGKASNQQRFEHQAQSQGQQAKYARARYQQRQGASPAVWVGLGAFVLVGLIVVSLIASNLGAGVRGTGQAGQSQSAASSGGDVVGAAGETQSQLDQQAVVAQVGADGKQTVDVVLDSATFQYKPETIKVKQGVPVHFNLSVENGDPG